MGWRSDLIGPSDPADQGDLRVNTLTSFPPMKRSRIDVRLTVSDPTLERNRYVVAL
jgi:hypothetical protein